MKKTLFLFSFLIVIYVSRAQELPVDEETGKITFAEVVQVDNNSKDELFQKARNFGVYKKENVLVDDAKEGTFKTKGQFKVVYPSPMRGMNHEGVVNYTITIFVKDGRYRYEITDLVHSSPKGNGGKLEGNLPECGKYTLTLAGWGTIKKEAQAEMLRIIENLKQDMSKVPVQQKKKDDW
ncbi:MAG: DUF4468 domain-containing protein [Cytophagaceae bacterium]